MLLLLPPDLFVSFLSKYLPNESIPSLQRVSRRMKQLTDSRMLHLFNSMPSTREVLRYLQLMYETCTACKPVWFCPRVGENTTTETLFYFSIPTVRHTICNIQVHRTFLIDRDEAVVNPPRPVRVENCNLYATLLPIIADSSLLDPLTTLKVLVQRREHVLGEMRLEMYVAMRRRVTKYYQDMLRPFLVSILRPTICPLDVILSSDYTATWVGSALVELPENVEETKITEYNQIKNILQFLIQGWVHTNPESIKHDIFFPRRHVTTLEYSIADIIRLLDNNKPHFQDVHSICYIPTQKQILEWISTRLQSDVHTRFTILLGDPMHVRVVEVEISNRIAVYRCYYATIYERDSIAELSRLEMGVIPQGCTIEEMMRNKHIPGLIDPSTLLCIMNNAEYSLNHGKIQRMLFEPAFDRCYQHLFRVGMAHTSSICRGNSVCRISQMPRQFGRPQLAGLQYLRLLTTCWLGNILKRLRSVTLNPTNPKACQDLVLTLCTEIMRIRDNISEGPDVSEDSNSSDIDEH